LNEFNLIKKFDNLIEKNSIKLEELSLLLLTNEEISFKEIFYKKKKLF